MQDLRKLSCIFKYSKSEYERSGRYNTDVSLLLEKSQQKNNESEETFGDDYEKGSSNTEKKTKFIKSSKVRIYRYRQWRNGERRGP